MVDKLPFHLRDEYHEAFGLFDPRGQEYITVSEYVQIIKSLDSQLDNSQIQSHLGECQITTNTKIDIDLFTSSITKLMVQPFPKKEIVDAFAEFDQQKQGKMSYAELRQAITVIGEAFFTVDEKDTFLEAAKKFSQKAWMKENGCFKTGKNTIDEIEEAHNKFQKWVDGGGELMINYYDFTDHMYEICLSNGEDPSSRSNPVESKR